MREKLIIATKLVACLPLAWFGGNIVFGILATGTWIFTALFYFVQEWVFDLAAIIFLWLCRIVVLIFLLLEWVFERQINAPRNAATRSTKQ